MPSSLTITNAFVMPGVSAVSSSWSLLVGLVVDERQIGWGECLFDSAESDPGLLNDYSDILQELIIPALMGRPLSDIPALMEPVDAMRHEVTVEKPITAETPPQKRSRRELFTSLINPDEVIREVVERPLPAPLRHGVSQAIISAAAAARNVPAAAVIAGLYGLSPARKPLPIHLIFDELPNTADPALVQIPAASYGLTVSDDDPHHELGSSGIRFQNRVRQLKNRAARYVDSEAGQTGFLFDMKGGYGVLYEGNTGSILGALNGLEQTVTGFTLRVADPVIAADRLSQIAFMKELKEFVRFRKMGVRLLARAWVESAADVDAFAEHDCCDGLLLDMARLGTLHRTITLAQAAQARGLEVVLAGVNGSTAVHTALALNPALLGVGVGGVRTRGVSAVMDEMNRTVAWLSYKQ